MELKKRILGEFIFLMKTDFVIPVLNYMIETASKIDESLSVYFVQEVKFYYIINIFNQINTIYILKN